MVTHLANPVYDDLTGPGCCPASGVAVDALDVLSQDNTPIHLPNADPSAYIDITDDGVKTLNLMVENLHCAACIRTIENGVLSLSGVTGVRLNMSTRRLKVSWSGVKVDGLEIMRRIASLGYPVAPYDPAAMKLNDEAGNKKLLAALAVAGFAAANVMLLSIAVWSGAFSEMGYATRTLFHWVSALIALPAVAYAGQPFFHSAVAALKDRRLNMDVPISLAVVLAALMSLYQTIEGGEHAYFDASVTLLFFLLVGRYLDTSARSRARSTAEHLLALNTQAAIVIDEEGHERALPVNQLMPGMMIRVAAGDRIGADGTVISGCSLIDSSLVSGETVAKAAEPGINVYAGTMNVDAPLLIEVDAAAEDTLLAEIVRLVEAAEQGRAKYVRLAERAAAIYAPVVHILAALTFAGWMMFTTYGWETALMTAIAVLIITCPCALGLAVPAVQVVASGLLLRAGILVKSADGLERIAQCDYIVFDKTGTLTRGEPLLLKDYDLTPRQAAIILAMAKNSRHPLSKAVVFAFNNCEQVTVSDVEEIPGRGIVAIHEGRGVKLGSREHCGIVNENTGEDEPVLELWFSDGHGKPVRLQFTDRVREDGGEVVEKLKHLGLPIEILSGDRNEVVADVASALAIETWRGHCLPIDKVERIETLGKSGRRVLMVGDGLNDAPALASGFASISPVSAPDISQTAADLVFRGEKLVPVLQAIRIARAADALVKQNFGLAILYNCIAVPLAVIGLATPLVAAVAMSSSSILVTLNAIRLRLIVKG
jgi:Cu2+-exporting ATPase